MIPTSRTLRRIAALAMLLAVPAACAAPAGRTGQSVRQNQPPAGLPVTPTPSPAPASQPVSPPVSFGPNSDGFPGDVNPLSGLQVEDPSLLKVPAVLVSISHFPPLARPQAGLSFAPWVFEYYITEGATRFLAAFYGRLPQPEIPLQGDCQVRTAGFNKTGNILGNRVWLDVNRNGRQEPYESGVGGVCVHLLDQAGSRIESTSTDSNGYYGFNPEPGSYVVEFSLPAWLAFTKQNVGDENADSDPDPASGRAVVNIQTTSRYLDAGLIPSEVPPPTPDDSLQIPKAEIGPIRSGRLIYADIAGFFQSSCLIYAFASHEVLEEIPKCSFVKHEDSGGGSMMEIERLNAIAVDNMKHTRSGFTYASNLFSDTPPEGGSAASRIDVYVAYLNQSGWMYDPLSESWLRYVDNAEESTAGQLHPEIDRLTGRQLQFENVIVIYVEHDVISPTNLDIHLEQGDAGYAFLFRDGRKFDIRWSTRSGKYEQQTGFRRPMQFLDSNGGAFPLKPGSTWIFVATPFSNLTEEGDEVWRLRYSPPQGAK